MTLHAPEDIHAAAINHFQKLLNDPSSTVATPPSLHSFVSKSLSLVQASELIKRVSYDEIKAIVFQMKPDNAPGPNEYSASFFQKSWHIVGQDVVQVISFFFYSGRLLKELNHTLAPKKPNPTKLSDFRPIACCNFYYKWISGILAAILKAVLPSLIDKAQVAFIPGQCLSDNIFIVQELLTNYHRSDTQPRCTIKVDILKAYDTEKWSFLFDLLFKLGFPL